jgi:hypothetical protein
MQRAASNRGETNPDDQPPLGAAQAEALLQSIDNLSFTEPKDAQAVARALSALAGWAPGPRDRDVAVAWIKRIYQVRRRCRPTGRSRAAALTSAQELKDLPIDSHLVLYGKGLRRLRTLCGGTEPLPDDFDVAGDFAMPSHAIFKTPASDVYKGRLGTRVVAIKMIRSDEHERAEIRKVRGVPPPRGRAAQRERSQKLRKEAIAWQLLRHPNIVPFLGVRRAGVVSESVQLISIWMDNGELTKFLQSRPDENPVTYVRRSWWEAEGPLTFTLRSATLSPAFSSSTP